MNRHKDKKFQPNQPSKKEGRPIQEVVPPLLFDKKPREIIFTKQEVNNIKNEINKEYECFSEPNQVLPEWPGNEVANVIF